LASIIFIVTTICKHFVAKMVLAFAFYRVIPEDCILVQKGRSDWYSWPVLYWAECTFITSGPQPMPPLAIPSYSSATMPGPWAEENQPSTVGSWGNPALTSL